MTNPCPNRWPCEHGQAQHEYEGATDPLPMCGVEDCACGSAPAGFKRVPSQRVWLDGDTVPADQHVIDLGGNVVFRGVAWTNIFGPVVQVEPVTTQPEGN